MSDDNVVISAKKRTTINLNIDVYERLQMASVMSKRTISTIINEALRSWFEYTKFDDKYRKYQSMILGDANGNSK